MAQAAVGADLHQALDVLGALAAQVALDLEVLDRVAQLDDLVVGEVAHARVGVDPASREDGCSKSTGRCRRCR